MEFHISASEAVRKFSDIINRIRYRGEEFIVERGGEPVCRIVPVMPSFATGRQLATVFKSIAKPDPEYWDAVADAIRNQPLLPNPPWPH
jgi:antitoxin (DNA-binding transcriptional repressor) of toxin-antitoxin stability system